MNNPLRSMAIFLAFCTLAGSTCADTLYRRDGEQAQGRLKSMSPDQVVFSTHGADQTLPKKEVIRIQLQQPRRFDEIDRVDQITDPELKTCIANNPSEKTYPDDGSVILFQQRIFDLTTPGIVRETVRTISKVLRQRGEDTASITILYFEDTDQPAIDFALTATPDGRVLHLDDAALKNESLYARMADYRRLARLRFACKEPRPGSILDVQYTVARKRDPQLEPFYVEELFQGPSPILRKELLVRIPAAHEDELVVDTSNAQSGAWKAKRSLFKISSSKPDAQRYVEESRKLEGEVVCRSWHLKTPQPGIIEEPNMPPLRNFVPTITLARRSSPGEITQIFSGILEKLPPLPDPINQKAIALAQEGGARSIYNYVTRNIRSIPVPHTQFRMTPHPAADVIKRGIGNELDKNVVYFQMLEAANIPCTFTLIRDRRQGNPPKAIASIREYGRSAVYLPQDKKYVTTIGDVFSFDTIPADFQSAVALPIVSSNPIIRWIEEEKPEKEQVASAVEATLNKAGDLEMTITYTVTGNAEATFRALKDLDDEQFQIQMQQMAGMLHPSALLKSFKKTDLADLNLPPSLTLTCSIPGYATKAGEALMLFNLPGLEYNAGDVGRPDRTQPLFFAHVASEVCHIALHLPEGYGVYALPGNVKTKSPLATYQGRFKKTCNQIIFDDSYQLKTNHAEKEAYPAYKHCHEMRADVARQRIILMKTN